MRNKRKGRGPYNPGPKADPRHCNALIRALVGAAKMPPRLQAEILAKASEPAQRVLAQTSDDLAFDLATSSDYLNVAEVLAIEFGICSDRESVQAIDAGQQALRDLFDRAAGLGTVEPTEGHLKAIGEALFRLKVQLEHCSASEWDKALQRYRNNARSPAGRDIVRVEAKVGGAA